jgi:chromosome segregation ATPase
MNNLEDIKIKITNLEQDIKMKITNLEQLIIEKFEQLDKKIDSINDNNNINNKKMDDIKIECTKMGSHIDFIEDTYNILQTPLNYVKKSVERLIGSSSKDLKMLPIKDKDTDV